MPTATDLWPCSTCAAPGVRNLGTDGYCALHLSRLYTTFHQEVWEHFGIGLIDGRERSDVLAGGAELACSLCEATWIGAPFETCAYCVDRIERTLRWQAELVLEPPDIEFDDPNVDTRIMAWADRLDVAVAAGIVTRDAAVRVLLREVHRDRAA